MSNLAEIVNFPSGGQEKKAGYVKADTDNGYYRVANEIGLALCKVHLNDSEGRIVHAVMQKTFGWNKPLDWICYDQLSELTGIDASNIGKVKTRLVSRRILIVDGKKTGINTVVSEWQNKPKTTKKVSNRKSTPRLEKEYKHTFDKVQVDLQTSLSGMIQKKDTITKDNTLGRTSSTEQEHSQELLTDIPAVAKPTHKKPKTNKIDFIKLANAYHEILDDMPSVLLPLSEKRKNKIKTLSKKYGLTNERWQAYFEYVAEHCQWMSEDRPDPKTGKTWKKKNLDFLISEDCYISVKEQRANDYQ